MCGYFNRAGQLCGKCKQNHSIAVYSYDMKCVRCSVGFGWVKYILAAFLPLTVFFILVLSCRLSATSPQLSTFVLLSQFISLAANVRIALTVLESSPIAEISARVILSIYGIWNLDFFRTLIPHICVSVSIDTLQALALDYAIAFYPLILLVLTYVLTQVNTFNNISSLLCADHCTGVLNILETSWMSRRPLLRPLPPSFSLHT